MKSFLFLVFILCLGTGTIMYPHDKKAEKAAKKAEKEAKKAAEEAAGMALFEQCVKAMENRHFTVEADRIEVKRGLFTNVNSGTNFVQLEGDLATIQLSFNGSALGANGMGGLTVDGRAEDIDMKTDKKGNVTFRMRVKDASVSATITIKIAKGTNQCTAFVNSDFNGNRINFSGVMKPSGLSNVIKGRSW